MPTNALVYLAGTSQQAVLPLVDPARARAARLRRGRDAIPELDYANSLYVASGRWPARGWILVKRSGLDAVNKFDAAFQLNFTDVETGTSVTFLNLSIVQSRCVSRGVQADPDAIYLVELTDARGGLWSPWFAFPTTSQYNVRAPAYPGQFYEASLNAGAPWTWAGMVADLWGQMGGFLGAFPGLPFAPAGTPEGFVFPGVPCWLAMHDVIDYLGMSVNPDLTSTAPYTITEDGAADAALAASQTKYAGLLQDDLEYIDQGAGRIPGTMFVYFHRRNEFYGTEETVRRDGLQWQSTPLYEVAVAAPARFAGARAVGYLWDDFTVRFDADNNPLAADVATANAIAADRVNEYYETIYKATVGYMRQVYAGALPFASGPQVDGVCWRQDYRNGRAGFVTEVIRGPDPPWETVRIERR